MECAISSAMSKSSRIKTLDLCINEIVVPFLILNQFVYTKGTRTFRKRDHKNGFIWIIDFQTGQRSMEGRFTVNLGVFFPVLYRESAYEEPPEEPREFHCHPQYRQRLGSLRETAFTAFFRYLVKDSSHLFTQWLTTPPDRWWRFSEDKQVTMRSLKGVLKDLEELGLPWLKAKSEAAISSNKKKENE
jgi:exonuclease III